MSKPPANRDLRLSRYCNGDYVGAETTCEMEGAGRVGHLIRPSQHL